MTEKNGKKSSFAAFSVKEASEMEDTAYVKKIEKDQVHETRV